MKRFKTFFIILTLLIFNIAGGLWLANSFRAQHQDEPVEFGVSFSQKYAHELGLDWRQTYKSIISELDVNKVRLMSYWDEHEPTNDEYDFADLDWMITEARKNHVSVSLAIGLRQPRWPECHSPGWVNKLNQHQTSQELLEYLTKVVGRYKKYNILESWQLENEASNALFGSCPKFDKQLYETEFDLVKAIDPTRDLITNASNQVGLPLLGKVGDRVGFSIYSHATPRVYNRSFRWTYWYVPSQWHSLRAATIEALRGTNVFIHELQAEPWGHIATHLLSKAEQDQLMNPKLLKESVDYALDTGIKEVHLWGAEWWYWQKTQLNDPAIWQTAQTIFRHP